MEHGLFGQDCLARRQSLSAVVAVVTPLQLFDVGRDGVEPLHSRFHEALELGSLIENHPVGGSHRCDHRALRPMAPGEYCLW